MASSTSSRKASASTTSSDSTASTSTDSTASTASTASASTASATSTDSTASTSTASTTSTSTTTYYATLTRGKNYALKYDGKIQRFKKGVKKAVSEELKAYLAKTAIDYVTVDEGNGTKTRESRAKFTFTSEASS